jgi:hypothetical protein
MSDLPLINVLSHISNALEKIAENTKQQSVDEVAAKEIMDLRQTIRNFGMELQNNLDNPPPSGMEMARRMRELAARMSTFGIPDAMKARKE